MDSVFDSGGNVVGTLRNTACIVHLIEELVCLSNHKIVELSESAMGGLAYVLLAVGNGLDEIADHLEADQYEADHYEKVAADRAASLQGQMVHGGEGGHKGQPDGGKIQGEDAAHPPEGQCQIPCKSFEICKELIGVKKRKKTA